MKKLKNYKPLYVGSGIIKDTFNKVFNINFNDYTKKSRDILKLVGNDIIYSIKIIRTPINKLIENVLNVVSLGKFIKNKSYDNLFHLSIIINNKILIEKNQSINISLDIETNSKSEYYTINWFKTNISVNELLENTRLKIGNDKYFDYNSFNNNCQNFVINILRSNKILDNLAERFILQDITGLIENMPEYSKDLSTGLTDFASVAEKLIGGHVEKLFI